MNKKNMKYIIGIVIVMLVSVLALGGCKKKRDKDKETSGVEGGLQVEESGEGDVIEFEDAFSDDEDDKTDTDKDGVVDKEDDDDDNDGILDAKDEDDNNDGTPDVEDPKHPSYEGSDKEEDKDDNKDNNNENIKDDDETGWSPFF